MTRDYENKVVVLTGASAGIGAAAAIEIGRRGGRLVLAARRADALAAVARQAGDALPVVADVTVREDVQRIFDEALERYGRVDAWINNAGRGITRNLLELDDDDLDAMMRDNVKSALYGMQVVVPHFMERGDGVVVNVSSQLGRVPFATFRSAYSAAKAALNSLGETLRMELAKSHPNVRVVTFLPGPVATEFGLSALGGGVDSRQLPNAQSAEEVARMLADATLTRRGDVYTMAGGLDAMLAHFRRLGEA